ncbi:hypothetical protein BKA64DRAFT_752781 [Cadophora sp. MPI-SDFR-AT-0126]|nr:hypothetical protein BKA64DRAFT_752781 [Leotiomycetes sp. MPI-SDFR-AT-0126]
MPDTIYATIVFENPGPAINNKASHLSSDESRQYKARRPHTKSRKGCSTCKIRHLKCDEHKPTCGQCIHGHRDCSYTSSPVTSKSSSRRGLLLAPGAPSQQLRADFLNGYYTGLSEVWKKIPGTVDPMELLDHFMHTNHRLWIGGPSCQKILQQHGPRLTVEAPYLRFAVLSFSAYHLATVRPRTEEYELAGAIYYNCALQSYATALHDPAAAEVDALFGCSILLSMIAYKNLASSSQRRDLGADKEEPVVNMTGLRAMAGFRVLKGVPVLQPKLGQSVMIGQCEEDGLGYLKSVAEYSEKLAVVERLEEFCKVNKRGTTTLEGVHDAALSSLRQLMLSEVGDGMISTYFFFTRGFDSRFLSSLESKDPKSLLLLCYWYAMGVRIGQWWMADSARLDGMKLLNFLRENPSADIQGFLGFPSASLESA